VSDPTPPPIVVPDRKRLLAQIAGALGVATILVVLVILPAEYRIDPTGFGRLTGLDQLSAPVEIVVETRSSAPPEVERVSPVPFRTDEIVIDMTAPARGLFNEVEYKVTMQPGETLLYSWTADTEISFEFHGHASTDPRARGVEVMNYRSGRAREMSGTLVAPMAGIQGWYFRQAGSVPFTIHLKLAGYYELTPGRLEIGGPF
jgi:hypothetical protein